MRFVTKESNKAQGSRFKAQAKVQGTRLKKEPRTKIQEPKKKFQESRTKKILSIKHQKRKTPQFSLRRSPLSMVCGLSSVVCRLWSVVCGLSSVVYCLIKRMFCTPSDVVNRSI